MSKTLSKSQAPAMFTVLAVIAAIILTGLFWSKTRKN